MLLLRVLFLLFFISLSMFCLIDGIQESVIGVVTADDILYTHVAIPRHAYRVFVVIWVPPSSTLIPKILLRYDALPSPDEYDQLLEFNSAAKAIEIIDDRPTASTLYIGVWGGELLHSYRYFAGEPNFVGVMIESKIDTCQNELEIYNFESRKCELLPILTVSSDKQSDQPSSCTKLTLNTHELTSKTMHSLLIPSNILSMKVNLILNFNKEQLSDLCSAIHLNVTSNSVWPRLNIDFEAYLDQLKEELNSYSKSFDQSFETICSNFQSNSNSSTLTLPLQLLLPLNGIWILESSFNITHSLGFIFSLSLDSCISINSVVTSARHDVLTLQAKREDPYYSTYTAHPVALPSSITPLNVLYMMDLTNTRYQLSPNGKSFQFSLHLEYHLNRSTIANPMIVNALVNRNYAVTTRLGNLPFPDDSAEVQLVFGSLLNSSDLSYDQMLLLQSSNLFELLSQEAKKTVIQVKHGVNNYILRVIYQWSLLHPKLSIVNDLFVDHLYFKIDEDFQPTSEPESIESSLLKAIDPRRDVTFSVVTGYCSPNTCDHGICYIKSNYITTSVCYCKYPWAGERCDQLTVSDWFFQIQVFALTASNLAMIPAIIFSLLQQLYLIFTGLFFAMIASIVYHLCDTDYYCLWNLSFLSLQVFDILFCNVMITSVLIFYSPFSEKIHKLCLLIVFGILLSFTVNNPTSPINLVFSFSIALIVNLIGWLYYYCQSKIKKPTLLLKIIDKYRVVSSRVQGTIKAVRGNLSPNRRRNAASPLEEDSEDDEEEEEAEDDGNTRSIEMRRKETRTLLDDKSSSNTGKERRMSASRHFHQSVDEGEEDEEDKIEKRSLFYYHRRRFSSSNRRYNDNDDLEARRKAKGSCCSFSLFACCCSIKHMLFGMLCGLLGLTCFIIQTRENYWIFHSSWHVLVMISSYLLLKGKYEFFEMIRFVPLKKKWFEG